MPISHESRLVLFKSADLYPVITSGYCNGRAPLEVLKALLDAGIKVVQMREKGVSDRELLDLALAFRALCPAGKVVFIVNDRVDIALAAQADGVHLGQDDLAVGRARALAPDLLLGVSTHNLREIEEAQRQGASYVNLGPVFPTKTKEHAGPAIGLENLASWSRQVKIPFSVMGGIKEDNISSVRKAGASIFAMVTELTTADDIPAKIRNIRERMRI